ncbi:DUF6702 family protein [Tenacibaculum sp. UWU-22]|uniref:DUF6702 family protein n=1 Tax=Tenacibaculum sp. UWU-22 TaxID=3234187 RepID=UPI0034DAF81C
MKTKKRLLLLFIIPLLSFSFHRYYVSLTQIQYSEKDKSLQIIMNVFMDDIEVALNKEYKIDARLTDKDEVKNINTYFTKYINEHLKITVNNKPVSYNFIGKEYDGKIVYFYLEIENITDVKTIGIENDVLTAYFPHQKNLIKSNIKGEHHSLLLTKNNDKGLLNFK